MAWNRLTVAVILFLTVGARLSLAQISHFNLIDADRDIVITEIKDGDTLDLVELAMSGINIERLNIEAVVPNAMISLISAVEFEQKVTPDNDVGPYTYTRPEKEHPYALFGDNSGKYSGDKFETGLHDLTAIAKGTASDILSRLSISFTVVGSRVEGFSTEIGNLPDGGTINISQFSGDAVKIQAQTIDFSSPQIESIQFLLTRTTLVDTTLVNTTLVDTRVTIASNVFSFEWVKPIDVGNYTLKADYFSRQGRLGPSFKISFSVIRGTGVQWFELLDENGGKILDFSEFNPPQDTINLDDLYERNFDIDKLNIRAKIDGPNSMDIDSVSFELQFNGLLDSLRGTAPDYLLFDSGQPLAVGSYKLIAEPHPNSSDITVFKDSISFFVTAALIENFLLIDATSDSVVQTLIDDGQVDLVTLARDGVHINDLSMAVNLNERGLDVNEVFFDLKSSTGDTMHFDPGKPFDPENPFSVFGEDGHDYKGDSLSQGSYKLEVTPRYTTNLIDTPNVFLSSAIEFEFLGPRIENYSLIDSDRNIAVRPIVDGDTLQVNFIPENFTIRVNTIDFSPETIESVRFTLTKLDEGTVVIDTTDHYRPYALFGDCLLNQCNEDVDLPRVPNYFPWPSPSNGTYELISTWFTGDQVKTDSDTLTFVVSDAIPSEPAMTSRISVRDTTNNMVTGFTNLTANEFIDITDLPLGSKILIELTSDTDIKSLTTSTKYRIRSGDATYPDSLIETKNEFTFNNRQVSIEIPLDKLSGAEVPYNSGSLTFNGSLTYYTAPNTHQLDSLEYTFLGPRISSYSTINIDSSGVDSEQGDILKDSVIEIRTDSIGFPVVDIRANLRDPARTIERVEFILTEIVDGVTIVRKDSIPPFRLYEDSFSGLDAGSYELISKWFVQDNNSQFGVDTLHFSADNPPKINLLSKPKEAPVRVQIIDNVTVNPTINFRAAGGASFLNVKMDSIGLNTYEYEFDFNPTFGRTIEYFITATDDNGFPDREPAQDQIYAIPVSVEGQVFSQDGGLDTKDYRLISIPLALTDQSAKALLERQLGAYEENDWRLFIPGSLIEYSPTASDFDFRPGKTFWLITRTPQNIESGPGETVATDTSFTIELEPGWNYFANPYNFAIPYANLSIIGDSLIDDSLDIRIYPGDWQEFSPDLTIKPFSGYAIYRDSSLQAGRLVIDPILTPVPDSKGVTAQNTSSKREEAWSIRVKARSGHTRDEYNFASVHPEASLDWDVLDKPEAPGVGSYVSVYFSHPDWDLHARKYSRDVRPTSEDGGFVWPIEVATNIKDQVELTFEGLLDVPDAYEIWLIDDLVHVSQNLREDPTYTLKASLEGRSLQLVVGSAGFVEDHRSGSDLIPQSYDLFPNFPNPFQTSTTIRYALPAADNVTLEIYNLLGQQVAVLEQGEEKEAGYHALVWDGRGRSGEAMASGVYFARLQSQHFAKTIKMVLVR